MINIQQDSFSAGAISNLISKYGETQLKLNIQSIESDIDKATKMLRHGRYDAGDRKVLRAVIKYLKRLETHINTDCEYNLSWRYEDFGIRAYPVPLRHFIINGVKEFQSTDYIELNDMHIIGADYSKLFEAITYELMYRDLGKTFDEVEEELSDCGIVAIYPYSRLAEVMGSNDGEMIDIGKVFRIGDSPYATKDGKLSWDYFGTAYLPGEKAFDSGLYNECVTRSINVASVILTRVIINNCISNKINFNICSIGEGGFYFMVDKPDIDDNLLEELLPSATVRVFGRQFEVCPNRTIY